MNVGEAFSASVLAYLHVYQCHLFPVSWISLYTETILIARSSEPYNLDLSTSGPMTYLPLQHSVESGAKLNSLELAGQSQPRPHHLAHV